MDYFHYKNRELYCEDVPAAELAATYGTPLWVYSKRTLLHHLNQVQTAFADVDPVICYSVKSNSNLGVLKVMQEAGSSFDVVSAGEFYRVKIAGADTSKIIFAGVGKTDDEIRYAFWRTTCSCSTSRAKPSSTSLPPSRIKWSESLPSRCD